MGIVHVSSTETKWTWLQKRLAGAQAEVDAIAAQIQGLQNMALNADGTATTCLTCGHEMLTEEDFAKHYIVPDPRYLNLGECPTKLQQRHDATKPHPETEQVFGARDVVEPSKSLTGKTYADVLGPMKDILHPDGI